MSYKPGRNGFEFLESDNVLYYMLLKHKERGDEILELFNIDFINESYSKHDSEEVNSIYVLRDEMNQKKEPSTHNGDGYNTRVQIVIRTSNYNTLEAQSLLKTTVRTILQYIEYENIKPYCKLNRLVPRYATPGRVSEYIMEFNTVEIDEKCYDYDLSHNLRIQLGVEAMIQGGDKHFYEVFPLMKENTGRQLNNPRQNLDDDEGFVRG